MGLFNLNLLSQFEIEAKADYIKNIIYKKKEISQKVIFLQFQVIGLFGPFVRGFVLVLVLIVIMSKCN